MTSFDILVKVSIYYKHLSTFCYESFINIEVSFLNFSSFSLAQVVNNTLKAGSLGAGRNGG